MPIIFGFLAGNLFGRALFSRIPLTFAMWFGLAYVGFRIGAANVSLNAGRALAILLPGSLLAWALIRPATSRGKMWLIEGMLLMIFVSQLWYGAKAVLLLLLPTLRPAGVTSALVPALYVVILWILRAAILAWVRRSDRFAGPRSVLQAS